MISGRNVNSLAKDNSSFFSISCIFKNLCITCAVLILLLAVIPVELILFYFVVLFSICLLGEVIRRYTRPRTIITRGNALDVLGKKIYWSIGIQLELILIFYLLFPMLFLNGFSSKEETKEIPSFKEQIDGNNRLYRD